MEEGLFDWGRFFHDWLRKNVLRLGKKILRLRNNVFSTMDWGRMFFDWGRTFFDWERDWGIIFHDWLRNIFPRLIEKGDASIGEDCSELSAVVAHAGNEMVSTPPRFLLLIFYGIEYGGVRVFAQYKLRWQNLVWPYIYIYIANSELSCSSRTPSGLQLTHTNVSLRHFFIYFLIRNVPWKIEIVLL